MLTKNIGLAMLLTSASLSVNGEEIKTTEGPRMAQPKVVATPVKSVGLTTPIQTSAQIQAPPTSTCATQGTSNAVADGCMPMTGSLDMGNQSGVVNETPNELVVPENGLDETTKINTEAIRGMFAVFAEAVNKQDKNKWDLVARESLIVINSNQSFVMNKKTIAEYFPKEIGTSRKLIRNSLYIEPGATIEVGKEENWATVYGKGSERYQLGQMEYKIPTRWSAIVVKGEEGWKIHSFHSGFEFTDNPIMKAFEEFGWKMGGVGLAMGLLLGFGLSLLTTRFKKV